MKARRAAIASETGPTQRGPQAIKPGGPSLLLGGLGAQGKFCQSDAGE